MTDTDTWDLSYRERPWLMNAERSGGSQGIGGRFGRAKLVEEWRDAYAQLCQTEHVPPLEWASFTVLQFCRNNRLPDIGNCFPAAKAAVDGVVDAGILPDDCSPYVRALNFLPPVNMGYDALVLRISGPPCGAQERRRRIQEADARLARAFIAKTKKADARKAGAKVRARRVRAT